MRFYTKTHKHYCGIDLHAKKMFLCILDAQGEVLLHRNISSSPEAFLKAVAPFRDGLVVGVECMFAWYWLADLCRKEGIEFVLGHALYMGHKKGTGYFFRSIFGLPLSRLVDSNPNSLHIISAHRSFPYGACLLTLRRSLSISLLVIAVSTYCVQFAGNVLGRAASILRLVPATRSGCEDHCQSLALAVIVALTGLASI